MGCVPQKRTKRMKKKNFSLKYVEVLQKGREGNEKAAFFKE